MKTQDREMSTELTNPERSFQRIFYSRNHYENRSLFTDMEYEREINEREPQIQKETVQVNRNLGQRNGQLDAFDEQEISMTLKEIRSTTTNSSERQNHEKQTQNRVKQTNLNTTGNMRSDVNKSTNENAEHRNSITENTEIKTEDIRLITRPTIDMEDFKMFMKSVISALKIYKDHTVVITEITKAATDILGIQTEDIEKLRPENQGE